MGLTRYPRPLPIRFQTFDEDSAGTQVRIVIDEFTWTWKDEVLVVVNLIVVEKHADGTLIKKVLRLGVPVGTMEIMDEVQMNRTSATRKGWKNRLLFFEFSGNCARVIYNIDVANSHCQKPQGETLNLRKMKRLDPLVCS